jgi:predicted  nucleic acid-binding Zn-ribbon protein
MLERSLESVGNGQVTQPVWGTERQDEIGMLARAGEKLRHSLTETDALKALAQKGEVHITLNGDASVLLEKLAAGVTSAADALKSATTELNGMQSEQRARFDDALRKIGRFGSRIDEVADEIRTRATGSIDEAVADAASGMRDALDRMIGTADERTRRLGQVTGEFEQNGKLLTESVSLIRDRTATAVEGITTSMLAFKKAADGAESIQGAFFSACDRISSDAASTAENIRNLATQLYGAVENVDGRLNQKLEALDRIEAGIESALGAIRTRAEETTSAIIEASAALERHSAEAERRVGETVEGIDEVVRLFREDAPVNQSLPSRAVEDFQQIERSITRIAEIQATEYRELSSVIDNLNQVVEKLTMLTHQTSL